MIARIKVAGRFDNELNLRVGNLLAQFRIRLSMIAIALASLAVGCEDEDENITDATSPPAVEASSTDLSCPEAEAFLADAGLPVPDDFAPRCPTIAELRSSIDQASTTEQQTKAVRAIRNALEAGEITEGQDPATYPQYLQKYVD